MNLFSIPDNETKLYLSISQDRSGGNLPPTPSNIQVSSNGSTATLTWDIPTVTLSVDSIMAYNVYKNGNRVTTNISDLVNSTETGINELLKQNFYVDYNYTAGDIYKVTAVNFRNQESSLTTNLIEISETKDKVALFLNPAESFIQINGDFPANMQYSIFAIDGRIVLKGVPTNREIDIQALNTGIYVLQIANGNSVKFKKK